MGQAMCGFVGDIIDFEKLDATKKRLLKKALELRKKALQLRVNELDRAIKAFGSKRRRRRARA
jgi:hypothetical protein